MDLCEEMRQQFNESLEKIKTNDYYKFSQPVASSSEDCMVWLMASRSVSNSDRFRVPKTLRNVVAAKSRVEWL